MGWGASGWNRQTSISHSSHGNVPTDPKGPVPWRGYRPSSQGAHRPSAPHHLTPRSSPHPKFRRLWSLGASQGLQERLTTPESQQAGGKEEEKRNGREEDSREWGRECRLPETPKAGREGSEKVGSFPEERNHVQKAMEPLTQLSREMEMVPSVFEPSLQGHDAARLGRRRPQVWNLPESSE